MATIINAVSGTGLTQSADGSGVLKVQSNGVTTNALAWVNFNGTSATPITPRANYNISSVTKNGTGDYTLNFTSALSDANYVVQITVAHAWISAVSFLRSANIYSGSQGIFTVRIQTLQVNDATSSMTIDCPTVAVAIFGN